MKYKANRSFCGSPVSMTINEEKEFSQEIDPKVINDLVQCGLISPVEENKTETGRDTEPEITGDGTGEALPEAKEEKASEPVKSKRTKAVK